jgi:hypothetical protein
MKDTFDRDELRALPKNWGCNACGMAFQYDTAVMNRKPEPKRGDICVCAGCGEIMRVGPLGLEKMPVADIEKLDAQSKMILAQSVASVRVHLQQQQSSKN